jgi:hypothetical protein
MAGLLDAQALPFTDGVEPYLDDYLADLSAEALESLGTASPETCSTEWLDGVKCLLNLGESARLLPGCTVGQAGELSQPLPAEEQATRSRIKFAKTQTLKSAVLCRPSKIGNLKSDAVEPAGIALRIYVERGVSETQQQRVVLGLIEEPMAAEGRKLDCVAAAVGRVEGEDSELDEACFKSVNNQSPLRCEWDTAWQKRDAQNRTLCAVFVLIERAEDPANLGASVLDKFTHRFWLTHDGKLPGAHLTLNMRAPHQTPF